MKPTASGASSVAGGSAWAKPLALQSTSPSASPASSSSAAATGNSSNSAAAASLTPKIADSMVETPSTANLHGNDSLNGLNVADGGSGIQLDGSWSNSAFATNPSAASYLSNAAWTFPSVAGNNAAGMLPSTDASGNDFSTFNQSAFFQNLAVDAAKQQQMAGLNFSGLASANDFNKALMGSQSNETWNDFSALNQQQQQQQQQWAALSDAAKSGTAQFPLVQEKALPNTSPSESMEIVQSHFANLSAQHGGQLPINQAALDSLIQSAGAMPAGPEQQQLLTMIDMLLQLHNAGQNQQQQSNQQSQLNSNQAFGNAASNFAWNTSASNASSLLPSALTFPSLPTFTSSTGSAASLPAINQSSNAFSVDLLQQAQQQQQSQNGNSLLNSLRTDNGLVDEAALAGVALPSNTAANEWMSLAQFQASSSSAHSGASSSASGTNATPSLLADFGSSPIRPARTTTNAGYNDVPESASPFSYDQYTNLSVTARPFQPTPQPVAAATTTPAITAGADGLDSIASSFAALGGANTLLLQQQLNQQLSQQNELNASLAALGVAGSDRQLFDLSSGLYDPNDPMAALQMGNNNSSNNLGHGNSHHSHRDRNSDRDFGRSGGDRFNNRDSTNFGASGYNDRDRADRGDRQTDRYARYDKRGSSKVNDYNRSGMDRFDYIQHQVNQANKAKSRLFEEGRAGFLPPTRSGNRDFNEFPMNTPTQPVPSAAAHTALTPQQQQLLAQILAKSFGGSDAAQANGGDVNSGNGSNSNVSESTSQPSQSQPNAPVTMDAASALSTLTASPEFQSLTSQQQAQIYSSVQQMQAQQQAVANQTGNTTTARTDNAPGATGPANNSGAGGGVGVSPVLGALASPLSSSVVHITPNSKVEDVLAQIVKPDLAKLSELLRQQQVAITNAALGNSSTPASVSLPPNADDAKPVDKSKLRPPKPRARRTEFPDEAPSTSPSISTPSNESSTPVGMSAASVDPAALNQLQSVLQNASLSHSARVAVIRNVSASASATAFANAFVEALVKTVPNDEKPKKPEPAAAAAVASTVISPPVTAAVAPAVTAVSTTIPVMRVRKRHNIPSATDVTPADNANGSPSTNPSSTPAGDSASDVEAGKDSAGEVSSSFRGGSARRGRGGRDTRGPRPPRTDDKRGPRTSYRAKTEETGAVDNSAAPQVASSSGDNATESPPAPSSGPHSSRFNRGSNRGRGPRPANASNANNASDIASAAPVSSPSDVSVSVSSTRDSPQKRAGRGRGGYKGRRGGAAAESATTSNSAE